MPLGARGGCFLLLCLIAGCATQGAVRQVQKDLRQVENRLAFMGQQLQEIDSLLQVMGIESQHKWTGLAVGSEGMVQQIQQLQARMDEMARRLVDLHQELESIRVYGVGKGGSPAASPAGGTVPDTARKTGPLLVADPQALYDLALGDMRSGNYPLAISEFAQFLENFPGDELADNALYWQGECHYARKEFNQAANLFAQLLKDYPQGDKIPAALLKLGFSLLELKEKKKGIQRLRELVQNYPDTEEAALAQARLKGLGAQR